MGEIDGAIFRLKEEQKNWNLKQGYRELTFSDFLLLLDDFYLFAYSSKLKRSTWQVFNWLRYITRNDGFAKISYPDLIAMFCRGGEKMSSPTFFKCIEELVENELILKVNTKRVYNGKYQNGDNAYAIVSKTDIIYSMCDVLHETPGITPYEAYEKAIGLQPEEAKKVKPQPKEGSTGSKVSDKNKLKLIMVKDYRPVKDVVEKFFTFLGSYNKSNNIALSRKLDILVTIRDEYLTIGFNLDDIVYAMKQTMAKTSNKSQNFKRERYMFAILNNQIEYEEEEPENEVADKLSKEAQDEITVNYKGGYYDVLDEADYKVELKKISTISNYHKQVINAYGDKVDGYEAKLVSIAKLIDKKLENYASHKKMSIQRIRLLGGHSIAEYVEFDNKWNRLISWVYEEDEKPVPLSVLKEIKALRPEVFVFSKYELFDSKEELIGE